MGLEKETPLNPPIIVNPKLLVQTVYKKCIKKYLGIIAFASSVIVHRKRLALLAFVLIQLVVFFCVAYSLTSKKSYLEVQPLEKPLEIHVIPQPPDLGEPVKPVPNTSKYKDLNTDRTIFMITPTYARPTQLSDLTSLCQTVSLLKNVVWVVVEDSTAPTVLVTKLLSKCPVNSVHLLEETPAKHRVQQNWYHWFRRRKPHRGVFQRNAAIRWLREHYSSQNCNGVVYFADDDNRYTLEVFKAMRPTRVISVWAVGYAGGLSYEGPVCRNNSIVYWRMPKKELEKSGRTFPIDMAGFAINLCHLLKVPKAEFDNNVPPGRLEDTFISLFLSKQEELECRGSDNEVLVWHVRTEQPNLMRELREPADILLRT